jgi:hypothetical protein
MRMNFSKKKGKKATPLGAALNVMFKTTYKK